MSSHDLPIAPTTTPSDLLLGPGADALRRLGRGRRADRALQQAAKDFESVLLDKLLNEMKNTIPDSGLTGDGVTKQIQGIFWSYLARDIADKGGLGLWKELYQQWSQPASAAGSESRRPEPMETSA